MPGPLDGVKVVEIAQEIQGPYAGLFLADMGADVIKIEMRETGDLSRFMLVRLIAGPDARHADFSHYFLAMNRGKRSLTLDLKKPRAKPILDRLLDSADVLLTNYRPGVLDRLGFGYEALSKRNPGLIFAQGSSWGPEGPWVRRPSRDTLAQAAGGVMAKNGMPDDRPLPCGSLVADHSGAFMLMAGNSGRAVRARKNRPGPEGGRVYLWHRDCDAADGDQLYLGQRPGDPSGRPGSSVSARRVGFVSDPRRLDLSGRGGRQTLAGLLPGDGYRAVSGMSTSTATT